VGTITAVGGGAQSDVWCQIMADITGQPIRQLENPIQTNASARPSSRQWVSVR
jgi:xylulokinase